VRCVSSCGLPGLDESPPNKRLEQSGAAGIAFRAWACSVADRGTNDVSLVRAGRSQIMRWPLGGAAPRYMPNGFREFRRAEEAEHPGFARTCASEA